MLNLIKQSYFTTLYNSLSSNFHSTPDDNNNVNNKDSCCGDKNDSNSFSISDVVSRTSHANNSGTGSSSSLLDYDLFVNHQEQRGNYTEALFAGCLLPTADDSIQTYNNSMHSLNCLDLYMFFFNITSINTTTSHSYQEHNTTRIHNHHFHHRPGFAGFAYKHLNGTNVSDEKLLLTFVALPLLFVPVLTVFGNVLVVLSVFTDRNLQSVTNYFIVSLAVADIMVAIFVMPLAVYVEVNNSVWMLGDGLCDVWVALDVLCCTASILNLTAISFDRYFAVTYPIKYARHKNSKRVYIMVGLTWVISVAISSPIVFGANYTERRNQTKHLCTFYNSDFLIYSSMGSFYIPCILMIFLYGRIFNAIRIRAKKAAAQKRVKTTNCRVWSLADTRTNAANVRIIDVSEPPVERKTKDVEMNKNQLVNTEKQSGVLNVNEIDNVGNNVALTPAFEDRFIIDNKMHLVNSSNHVAQSNFPSNSTIAVNNTPLVIENPMTSVDYTKPEAERQVNTSEREEDAEKNCQTFIPDEISVESGASLHTHPANNIQHENDCCLNNGRANNLLPNPPNLICNDKHISGECLALGLSEEISDENCGCSNPAVQTPTQAAVLTSSVNSVQCIYTDPDIKCPKMQGSKALSDQECRNRDKMDLKTIHTFHFRFKKTKAKKNIKNEKKMQSSQRRERKATKTLAIVLGVFLFCWVPFFTINIMNAICIRYDLIGGVCELDPKLFSFFVWLGYMNSFINPVIYTIFNAEFRKAFKKLLKCFSK